MLVSFTLGAVGRGAIAEPPPTFIVARVLFEKPRLVVDDMNQAHGWLDFKKPVQIPAPFIHVECWADTAGSFIRVDERVTDAQGVVRFEGRPDGHYRLRAVPILSRRSGNQTLASAAIYRQEDPRNQERPGRGSTISLADYPKAAIQALAWPEARALGGSSEVHAMPEGASPVDWVIPVTDTKAGRKSGPFNILWMVYQSLEWVLIRDPGAPPLPMIHINWDPSSNLPRGTYFDQQETLAFARVNGAHAKDTDEFDDGVLGHELGHFVGRIYHAFISPGGDHGDPDDHAYDWTLTMSEGWATFFQGMVRSQTREPVSPPDYYDTLSPSTSTGDGLLLNQPAEEWRRVRKVSGLFNEGSVARSLWRFYCSPDIHKGSGHGVLHMLRRLPDTGLPVLTAWSELVMKAPGVDHACVAQILEEEGIEAFHPLALAVSSGSGQRVRPLGGALLSPGTDGELDGSDGSGNHARETAYYFLAPSSSDPIEIQVVFTRDTPHAEALLFLEAFEHARGIGEMQVRLKEVEGGVVRFKIPGDGTRSRILLRLRLETHGPPAPGRWSYQISAHTLAAR